MCVDLGLGFLPHVQAACQRLCACVLSGLCVCVCVRACLRACVRACLRACVWYAYMYTHLDLTSPCQDKEGGRLGPHALEQAISLLCSTVTPESVIDVEMAGESLAMYSLGTDHWSLVTHIRTQRGAERASERDAHIHAGASLHGNTEELLATKIRHFCRTIAEGPVESCPGVLRSLCGFLGKQLAQRGASADLQRATLGAIFCLCYVGPALRDPAGD